MQSDVLRLAVHRLVSRGCALRSVAEVVILDLVPVARLILDSQGRARASKSKWRLGTSDLARLQKIDS